MGEEPRGAPRQRALCILVNGAGYGRRFQSRLPVFPIVHVSETQHKNCVQCSPSLGVNGPGSTTGHRHGRTVLMSPTAQVIAGDAMEGNALHRYHSPLWSALSHQDISAMADSNPWNQGNPITLTIPCYLGHHILSNVAKHSQRP